MMMGGLLLFFIFFCLAPLLNGAPTEKPPDLLRFVLNVKPGIREPTPPTTQKPVEKVQKSSSAGTGGGINAMSVGMVSQGQSKSDKSQQSAQAAGGNAGQQQQAKSGAKLATGSSKTATLMSKSSSSNGPASAVQNGQKAGPAASKPPAPPVSAPAPVAAPAKPSAEDPYGLEIGATVETTTIAVRTAPPSVATTTAATTTASTTTKMPPCGPDVLFVLDSTGSVRLVYDAQRRYILDVAQQIDIGPNGQHVGLIVYSSKVKQRVVVELDEPQSKEQFLQTVRESPYHGGITATGTALGLTVKALGKRRQGKRTLVVVLTDGYTYDEWEPSSRALQALGPGVDVIVAGDVEHFLRPVLEKIAGNPAKVLLGEENKPKVLDYLRCQ